MKKEYILSKMSGITLLPKPETSTYKNEVRITYCFSYNKAYGINHKQVFKAFRLRVRQYKQYRTTSWKTIKNPKPQLFIE